MAERFKEKLDSSSLDVSVPNLLVALFERSILPQARPATLVHDRSLSAIAKMVKSLMEKLDSSMLPLTYRWPKLACTECSSEDYK